MLKLQPSSAADDSFLFEVYASTRQDELAPLGWSGQQLQTFLHMQYEMQKHAYHAQYPDARYEIVIYQDTPVGRITTAETEHAWILVDLALLPPYRNQGLGTQLLDQLLHKAERSAKSVRLHVLEQNPAQRLYARRGFRITGHRSPYIAMEWNIGIREDGR